MYHFIIGYTDLVAGIEDGIKEPTATFSACFGAAFIMIHPTKYAAMLAEKMQKHGATGWLVNTSWSRGRVLDLNMTLSSKNGTWNLSEQTDAKQLDSVFLFSMSIFI
ncbi:hypothetical protein AMTR_s00758p00001980 [Amborella trichopoda]|uniref:Phosphoenolpyruvate carboxykinase (ATP) n=1 Tax=Amborella trichopoda TaxID=13333 RepID=W1NP93_AMBTC|nr:hypothetical protein AMTR_s00758p00001980 [Amborella trichopoda]